MVNVFREALDLLHNKKPGELTDKEQQIISVATIPLHVLSKFRDVSVEDGLGALATLKEMEELAEVRQNAAAEWIRTLFKGQPVVAGKENEGRCDFDCSKTGEPLFAFQNSNGHRWVCHMSCLQEQLDYYTTLKSADDILNQREQ